MQANFSQKQLAFQELFIGTLIYAVVLGLFNDYTSIVSAKSFSTILFASMVLEILTYLAFVLKKRIVERLKNVSKILMAFSIWLIMFSSKFIFVWVLDLIFTDYISINGFFGILAVVLSVTIIHQLAYKIFKELA